MRLSFGLAIGLLAPLVVLAATKPILRVHVSVTGARVLVDGREVSASAPGELDVPVTAGRHRLQVVKDGFERWESEVVVGEAPVTRAEVLLRLIGPPARADVPAGAGPKEAKTGAAAAPGGPRAIRVAIYEPSAVEGISARVVHVVADAVLAEMRKLERVSAISMAEVSDMLSFEQRRQLLGCDDQSCLAEIGGALGVDELLTGSLGALGDSQLFTLRRVDMRAATVKGSITRRFKAGDGEEFLSLAGPVIADLFPEYPLRPGRTRGVSSETVARLNPPPVPRWVFFTTVGAAAASAGIGTVFGVISRDAQDEHAQLTERSRQAPVDAIQLKSVGERASRHATNANIALAAAGVLALTAGVEALVTDWHGHAEDAPRVADVRVLASPEGVAVAGRF